MINLPFTNQTPSPGNANQTASVNGIQIGTLDALLADLHSEHENLLKLAELQRDAIIRADTKDLSMVVKQTAETLGRIASIEQSRQQIIKLPNGTIPTVDQITAQLRDQNQSKLADTLTERSRSLRTLMHRVNDEHQAVRDASLELSNHMNGLIKQVSAKLSHTGTYGRRGAVDPSRTQVISSLDTVQ